jgi:hypothetical protein
MNPIFRRRESGTGAAPAALTAPAEVRRTGSRKTRTLIASRKPELRIVRGIFGFKVVSRMIGFLLIEPVDRFTTGASQKTPRLMIHKVLCPNQLFQKNWIRGSLFSSGSPAL